MKHVWILNHHAHDPVTGKWTRHFYLARALAHLGWKVSIIGASFEHGEGRQRITEGEGPLIEKHDGVTFLWLKTSSYEGNGFGRVRNYLEYTYRALATNLEVQIGKPDVVIGTSAHLLAAWAGAKLSRRFDLPFIFEVRDLWPSTLIDFGLISGNGMIAKGMFALEKRLYRQADKIITVLPRAHEYIMGRGVCQERVAWIPNGVLLHDLPPSEYRGNGDVFTLLYIGSVGLAYGIDSLVDAMGILQEQRLPQPVRLRMVGGDGPHKDRLIKSASEKGVGNISFEKAIPKREIPNLLSEADAMVITVSNRPDLYRYGISFNKIFDSMASGLPVVVASGAFNNPIADAGCGITVPPEDPRALADGILKMMKLSPAERKELGQLGRKHVEEHYDYDILGERLSQILNDL